VPEKDIYDAVIVGAGFYGMSIARFLAGEGRMKKVLVLEREQAPMRRASLHNQARLHHGYHYPRSLATANASRRNMIRFMREFPEAVSESVHSVYAIATRHSLVTPRQFELFCERIGLPLVPDLPEDKALFDPAMVERVYRVVEPLFDAGKLTALMVQALAEGHIELRCGCEVTGFSTDSSPANPAIRVGIRNREPVRTRYAFNCTYSALPAVAGQEAEDPIPGLVHEYAELALVSLPESWRDRAITVMDGPFFSLTPLPGSSRHILSHVTYTPHMRITDRKDFDTTLSMPVLREHVRTRFPYMIRDAARYVPALDGARYEDSWYEWKTILTENDLDDGRPILFHRHADIPGLYAVLGGKLDNIYDVLARIEQENLKPHADY
jgi:glycine/D-amino acid oxidase-like deaminating enzyme